MADLSTTLAPAGLSGWAYDAARKDLDLTTADGKVTAWNVETQTIDFTLDIGGHPGVAAVSPDGRYLVVAESQAIVTSDPFAVTPTYADRVTRIDLQSHATTQVQYPFGDYDGPIVHLAVAADGTVLTTETGYSWMAVHAFDVNNPTAGVTIPSLQLVLGKASTDTALLSSDTGRYILLQFGDSTPGEAYLYESASHSIVGKDDPWTLRTGFQWGGGDVSEPRQLVVNVMQGGVYTFDLHMNPVANLSSYGANGAISAAAFSPDGSKIYLWQGQQSHVFVLDSSTNLQIGALDVSSTVDAPDFSSHFGMDVIDDGRLLVLDTGKSLEIVDISTKLNTQLAAETLSGGANADTLVGGAGDDQILGGDGANVLRGGYGADLLTGGKDADLINGNQGDDTIQGGAGANILFGGKGSDSISGGSDADFIQGNIGDDTVAGGDGADLIRGGQGNDSIVGGTGGDWLSGDLGSNTLVGGAGADVFHASGNGYDRVVDFNPLEGDRVQLDPGTVYTVSQYGADTMITIAGQFRMTLVGVQAAALPNGWIFGA